jgi:hypothetical protein
MSQWSDQLPGEYNSGIRSRVIPGHREDGSGNGAILNYHHLGILIIAIETGIFS